MPFAFANDLVRIITELFKKLYQKNVEESSTDGYDG